MTTSQPALFSDAARILESITDAFLALDAEWCFTYVNDQADRLMSLKRQQVMGKNFWELFPQLIDTAFDQQYHRSMAEQIPVSFETFYPTLNAWLEVRAFPSEGGLSVFFRDVSERRTLEAERERLLAETEKLLTEAQKRAEREAFLNRLGAAFRTSSDAAAVQETAVSLLGEVLGADRCYFALYDLTGGTVHIVCDWHRKGLTSVRGIYPFGNTAEMFRELYQDSHTSVIVDAHTSSLSAQTLTNMEGLKLRSRVSVALSDTDGLMGTLTAAMSEGPRNWTDEEVVLVEGVATQLRGGVEAARLQQRERRIASHLQAALLPAIPPHVPGLRLGHYYRAALAEAGIGGDFAQVFSTDEGVSHLIVGDLAGKGLAAAGQIATVTNMARYAAYRGRTLAGAVTNLNSVLVEQNLLTGFATLFIGRFDAETRTLTYVNAGQDAGLILRACTGTIERMPTTGPILGVSGGAEYTERIITLQPNDILSLFTDGLTEAGPSRTALLTEDGVAHLLQGLAGVTDPQAAAEQIIAGVDAYAGAGMRDDQCLLVGIVTGPEKSA